MDSDKEFFKNIFENTGNIEAYLIYKELSGGRSTESYLPQKENESEC